MTMRNESGRGMHMALLMLAALALLLLSACETTPVQPEPEPEPEPEPVAVEEPPPPPPPPATLQQAVDFLDLGNIEAAEDVLERIIEQSPGSRIARRFLDQIRVDPLEAMGSAYSEVEVQPGESLSVIAHRELGDSLQFFALARYNAIAIPRRLAPGMTVRIPDSLRPAEVDAPLMDTVWEEPLVEADPVSAEEPLEDDEDLVTRRRAEVLYAEGLNERQAGNLYLALSRFEEARELDPSLETASAAADATRVELVAALHEQAVALYRDQQIVDAISNWEEAIALDPDFEPAHVNLERARAVLRRLEELED